MMSTYAIALETLEQFSGQGSLLPWLMRIAINEAVKRNEELEDREQTDSTETATIPASPNSVSTGILNSTASPRNDNPLTPLEEAILVLRKIEKMRKREIATCLNISIEAVNYSLHTIPGALRNESAFLSARKNADTHVNQRRVISFLRERLDPTTLASPLDKTAAAEHKFPRIARLKQEHKHNQRLCVNIRTGLSKGVTLQRIKTYVDWYWQYHLHTHFKIEEVDIFPILGMSNPLVKKAMAEHRRLERLFERRTDVMKTLNRIEEGLEAHVRFEDRILFKEVERKTGERYADATATPDADAHHTWSDEFWK